jgi:hypothetical protein
VLTKQDFKQIEKKLKDYPTREELYRHLDLLGETLLEKLEETMKNYPTKNELFKRLDHIVGELETIRTEQILITHSQSDLEERTNRLEEIHPGGSHAFVPAS